MKISSTEILPSNRRFGTVLGGVLLTLAGYSLATSGSTILRLAAATAGALLLTLGVAAPDRLTTLNRAWHRLGLMMGRIVNPIVLGLLYFGIITPVALVTRRLGRDELRLRKAAGKSYWIEREPPGPQPDSFKNQY